MARNMPPQNPYLAARQEWNERYGGMVSAARAWRIVAMVSLTLALITTSYALWQSSQVKLVPYIVEVDKLGASAHGGFAQQIEQADNRVVRALLGDFIASLRAVTPDAGVQKGYVNKLYAMLSRGDAAENKVSAWFRTEGNSPIIRARTQTISVAINSIVPLSEKTWQIDWTEFIRDRKGKELGQKRFRAIATVAIIPPQDEETIRLNPIGLYIRDINWNARL